MATKRCDVCGDDVRIGGGIADLWNFEFSSTQGMTLELTDDTEHFLCFDCMERLPGDREPTNADIDALRGDPDAFRSDSDPEDDDL
ncbi:Uncharacterized protein AArcCO_0100 [Halalkaliarchaeum sp. AArc-CO]|uniref:DUF7561 family protein n=1 Tax=unclassified Halalkaliarchaeum TaxID=2678344 RepID=UPI00217D8378|nr:MULTISPECIES: hypothetical protein [unclassified Halalkaliarchaeum]MDR5672663.1 hypothetical protein [Halalkaliarchaeum sp. AArc-GB]UWG49432.1 Uncharacterized protein AArcCO_0100 [Halalkaliarchaeum sp. AArc-CO]